MKNTILLVVSAAALIGAGLTQSAYAQTVGVDFPGYYYGMYGNLNSGNQSAGVVPQTDWNVALVGTQSGNTVSSGSVTNANLVDSSGNSVSSTLMTSTGGTSSVTFDASTVNIQRGNGNEATFTNSPGDTNLASTGIANYAGAMSLTLGHLNANDNYTLIAYIDFDYYSTIDYSNAPTYASTIEVSLGASTPSYYLLSQPQSSLTGWTEASGESASAATVANYVEYSDISGAALASDVLTINNGGGLSGFQLIDEGPAVPEPSTWALMLGGLATLAFWQRRVRRA